MVIQYVRLASYQLIRLTVASLALGLCSHVFHCMAILWTCGIGAIYIYIYIYTSIYDAQVFPFASVIEPSWGHDLNHDMIPSHRATILCIFKIVFISSALDDVAPCHASRTASVNGKKYSTSRCAWPSLWLWGFFALVPGKLSILSGLAWRLIDLMGPILRTCVGRSSRLGCFDFLPLE